MLHSYLCDFFLGIFIRTITFLGYLVRMSGTQQYAKGQVCYCATRRTIDSLFLFNKTNSLLRMCAQDSSFHLK